MKAPFGAILAGGQSRRYGEPKALVPVGGVPIIERVHSALAAVAPDIVLLANEPSLFAHLGLPTRRDVEPGLGVLGGILTGLLWARAEGRPGILAVACDMPFLPVPLLRRLLEQAAGGEHDIVAPESESRRGVEPLCAYYGTGCVAPIEAALARGDRHVVGFFGEVRVERVPLAEVRRHGDPETLFLNVNTPAERARADVLVQESSDG
jgi:molybdopterin-guanine dinucleotide biosynthesis protein A